MECRWVLCVICTFLILHPLIASTFSIHEDSYRLPLEALPVHYDISLVPYLDDVDFTRNFTFEGRVSILVQALKRKQTLTLHAKDLDIHDTPQVYDKRGRRNKVIAVYVDSVRDLLVLHLEEPLLEGVFYKLYINYMGKLHDDLAGFYRSYYIENGITRWLGATQFQPTNARRAFPCFDEPALKATFALNLARLPSMTALSNMPLKSTFGPDLSLKGRYWDSFESSIKMSTYVIAFVVFDFHFIESGSYRLWSKPSMIQYGYFALELSPKIMSVMENITRNHYQLRKMDQIAVPQLQASAMENWGIVTYRENFLLLQNDSSNDRQKIARTISHEFAHQWFGNLVTPYWWKFTWLNEAFANFLEYFATNEIFPDWKLPEQYVVRVQLAMMVIDSWGNTQPITRNVETPREIISAFDTISYMKGGCVLKMIANVITLSTFYKGVQMYIRRNQYSSTVPDDLFYDLQRAVDEDGTLSKVLTVKDIMQTWTVQAGYPVVTVIRDYENGTATVRQNRFLLKKGLSSSNMWYVPLTYTTSTELKFHETTPRQWLTPNSNTTLYNLPGRKKWIIVNIQAMGFYRVNYDYHNWELLRDHLNSDDYSTIPPLNRAQILCDCINMVEAGLLDIDMAMEIISYLRHEVDVLPWFAAFPHLKVFYDRIKLSAPVPDIESYFIRLLRKFYNKVGFYPKRGESHLTSLVRPKLIRWVCLLDETQCDRPAARLLTPDVYETRMKSSLCLVTYNGEETTWERFWIAYMEEEDPKDRLELLTALGCTSNRELLTRLLRKVITEYSGLHKEDRIEVFAVVCSGKNAIGCELTLQFLKQHIHLLAVIFGGYHSVATIMGNIASNLNSQTELDIFLRIIKDNQQELSEYQNAAIDSVRTVEENIKHDKKRLLQLMDM